jgi:hypothetical protein
MNYLKEMEEANDLILWAEKLNPGSWVDHSRNVGMASYNIAIELQKEGQEIDPDIAYICGLLHDIGRYKGITPSITHSIDGYDFLMSKGFDGTANVCITHSIPINDIVTIQGWNLLDEAVKERFILISRELEWTTYDNIVTLCDALANSVGFCTIEQRLISVALRHGVNEHILKNWKQYFKLKNDIEEIIGKSIYHLLPGIEKSIY